jgi:RimJ/RimL family protein N-acetyltransferase
MDFSDLRFSTERLEIRRFVPDDFAAFHAYHSQPEVYRYLYAGPLDDAEAAEKFEKASVPQLRKDGDAAVFAVERRDDGAVIGEVVLKLESGAWPAACSSRPCPATGSTGSTAD